MPIDRPITVQRRFDHATIVLAGDFDVVESEELVEVALNLFSELTATVEVDMADVTFFGSRALRALLHLRDEVARHSGAEIRVTRHNESVRRILELAGVLDTLILESAAGSPMYDVA
jgi:anti-anti-sigma factor